MKEVSYSSPQKQEVLLTTKEPVGKHQVSEEAEGTRLWFFVGKMEKEGRKVLESLGLDRLKNFGRLRVVEVFSSDLVPDHEAI